MTTKEMSSLSVEPMTGYGLVVSVFEVDTNNVMQNGIPSEAFLEREEEFDIITVPYYDLIDGMQVEQLDLSKAAKNTGLICARSTDEEYLARWGIERFNNHFTKYGIDSIWKWSYDSGLRPCAIYLRHCYLAANNLGPICLNSFLDDTYLVDRKTTIRQYLQQYPNVLDSMPPPELVSRYSG